jgi:hypothetical protein
MANDLRDRVLAAVRKGLVGPLDPKPKKAVRWCEAVDSATEKGVREMVGPHTVFTSKIKSLTPSHGLSANRDSQPEKTGSAEPTAGCKVEVVELPQAPRYRKAFGFLQLRPPALVPVERWRQCVQDGSRFLAKWGEQAEALGWTAADLFGLHTPPAKPHPTYSRLSRYDCTGLIWLLQGRAVVALTADTATIRNPATGSLTTYRRFNKPALGPLGDSLDDLK